MAQGMVFLLNGTSSAGKTTLAKALQERLPEPAIHSGVDHILERAPTGLMVRTTPEEARRVPGWALPFGPDGLAALPRIGPSGLRILRGMYAAAAAMARCGVWVILDDVIYDPQVARAAAEELAGCETLCVGVHCDLAVACAREAARGDRAPGGAKIFADAVHRWMRYDLNVDTTATAPEANAALIVAAIKTQPRTALRTVLEAL